MPQSPYSTTLATASPVAYANTNLLRPLGITSYIWTAASDGLTFGAYGLYLRPRDLLQIGQVMLNGGQWHGQQLVPAEWVIESTSVKSTPPASAQPASMHFDYGYYW